MLRVPRVAGDLLVVTRHWRGASAGAPRRRHRAVGTRVVRHQHGRVAVVRAVRRVLEVGGRAVRGHGAARGRAAWMPGDDVGRRVSGRLRQTPRAADVGLQVERLRVVHRVPGRTRHARRSVGSPHPPPPPVVPLVEHVLESGVQRPIVALPVPRAIPGHFDEALVEGQVVPDAVLPALLVILIVGELGDDVVVYPAERLSLVAAVLDGHGDESHVGVRRLPLPAALLLTFGFRRGRIGGGGGGGDGVQEPQPLAGGGVELCVHGVRCVHCEKLRCADAPGKKSPADAVIVSAGAHTPPTGTEDSSYLFFHLAGFLTLFFNAPPCMILVCMCVWVESGVTGLRFDSKATRTLLGRCDQRRG